MQDLLECGDADGVCTDFVNVALQCITEADAWDDCSDADINI
jgi:hypothetical protein